ncbi:TIGR01777 family oxidoreductase [Thermodesulfobacteriota bacterium]
MEFSKSLMGKNMKIFMTGGTGFIGSKLTKALSGEGHQVTVLTRKIREDRAPEPNILYMEGNPAEQGMWQEKVAAEYDTVINLAGASIFRRWTKSAKRAIRDSRILTTQNLVEALAARKQRETLLINTSAVGYYGFRGEENLDEESSSGKDFLADIVREWEAAAMKAEDFGVRVILLRLGIVLGRDGGALNKMVTPYKWWVGSPLGSGKQWLSWIHERDLAAVYLYLLKQGNIAGPINCLAPYPVRNSEMSQILAEELEKPRIMPAVPGFLIKTILGEFGSVLLEGQNAAPKKLLDLGFRFQFPEIKAALHDLLSS